jgi:hypothetical protein
MVEENLVNVYKKQMEENINPGYILSLFYCELFDLGKPGPVLIGTITRLVKLYGREIVFYSILDMTDMENLDHNNIIRLLSYFCKKHALQEAPSKYDDLSKDLEKLKSLQLKNQEKEFKVKDPFKEKEK